MNLLKRAKHFACTAVHILKSTRQRKLLIRQKLVEHSDKMAPGLYIIGFRTAHRLFSPMPPTLKASKTSRLSPQIYPIASRLVYTFDSRFPPNFHYIPKNSSSSSDGDTTLFISALKNAKTFNLNKKTVTTYFEDKEPILHLEKAYNLLTPALPIPPQKINYRQLSVEEPFVQGTPFSAAPIKTQTLTYKNVLLTLASHIRKSSHTFMPSPQAESLISKVLKRKDLPETLKNTITEDYDAIHSLLTTSPVLPPHNDLHGRNILIGRSKLTFIDFELCENLPFFFDPLKLPLTEAYRHNAKILHLLLKKQFKEEWDAILSVAKMPRDFKLNQYLLAYLIIRLTQNSPWPGDPSLLWDAIYHHTAS